MLVLSFKMKSQATSNKYRGRERLLKVSITIFKDFTNCWYDIPSTDEHSVSHNFFLKNVLINVLSYFLICVLLLLKFCHTFFILLYFRYTIIYLFFSNILWRIRIFAYLWISCLVFGLFSFFSFLCKSKLRISCFGGKWKNYHN